MRMTKAQASIEFLATYGWALLGLFFVLAYLLGTGILSPSRFSSEECTFQPGISCTSFYIMRNLSNPNFGVIVGMNVTNKLGYAIHLRNYSVLVGDKVSSCSKTTCGANVTLLPGTTQVLSIGVYPITNGVRSNEFRRALISMNYTNCADFVLTNTNQTVAPNRPYELQIQNCLGNMSSHIASGRIMANVRR